MLQGQGRGSAGAETPNLGGQTGGDPADGSVRVLLADGHALVLRFMAFAFGSHGCVVHSAPSAEEVLQLLSIEPLDLVVADVDMPGLKGADLIQAVAAKQPGVPVVLTSAPAAESVALALREQAYDYLKQPFSAEDVQRLVQRVTADRRRPAPEAQSTAVSVNDGLSHIGDLALTGADTAAFVAEALEHTVAVLGADAGLVLLRDDEGYETLTQKGDPALARRLADLLGAVRERVYDAVDGPPVPLTGGGQELTGVATAIPGPGRLIGIVCLARGAGDAGWLEGVQAVLPVYVRVIAVSLQKMLVTESLEANMIDTISSFVVALEAKDVYLKGHSARVSLYVGEIGKTLGLPTTQVAMARRAGILHDLGKLVLNDAIYRKPGALTYEGSQLMREHPASGASILKPLRFLAGEAEAVKHHHERYDGSGYPDGLKGDEIPVAARIIAVADSFDALTSIRPYRAAMAVEQAVQEIVRHAGTQFDPTIAAAFARIPVARLREIAAFYENRPGPATAEARPPAGRRPGATVTWAAMYRAPGEKPSASPAAKVIGISRGTLRRQAREA